MVMELCCGCVEVGGVPVRQGSDDEASGVTQVLVAVLELRVGLAHHAVVNILHARQKDINEPRVDGSRARNGEGSIHLACTQ